MKQLLIVKKSNNKMGYNVTTGNDLSPLAAGEIAFFDFASNALLTAAPTKNFGIALGRPNNSPAFVIPEVDIKTLNVTKTLPAVGVHWASGTITVPTTVAGKEYTLILVKKGVVPHERNTWTVTALATSTTASAVADALAASLTELSNNGLPISVTHTSSQATLSIAGTDYTDWELKTSDELPSSALSTQTHAVKPVGDKAYVQDLASRCAAGKGFTDTYRNGDTTIPGYPEPVEDLTPNNVSGSSTEGYAIYTLRFAVSRAASKTRDEVVNQLVHIAVPVSGATYTGTDSNKDIVDILDPLLNGGQMAAVNDILDDYKDTLDDHEERITTLES